MKEKKEKKRRKMKMKRRKRKMKNEITSPISQRILFFFKYSFIFRYLFLMFKCIPKFILVFSRKICMHTTGCVINHAAMQMFDEILINIYLHI